MVPEDLAGSLADRNRIERQVGRGRMATVYLADDLKHGRRVAIKVLDPEVAAAIGRARFLREIEVAAGLTHPHILPLPDSAEAGGHLYDVTPYVEGDHASAPLGEEEADRVGREGRRIPFEEAIRLGLEARTPAGA